MLNWETIRHPLGAACAASLALLNCACSSKLVIASFTCPTPTSLEQPDASASDGGNAFAPWSTGFEDGTCDYKTTGGFCLETGDSHIDVVSFPVHSGQYAAAFTVRTDTAASGSQARCVRQGTLPTEAYYGAWYYIPSLNKNSAVWNLFHFQGGTSLGSQDVHGLWDISLINNTAGDLRLVVYQFPITGAAGGTPDMDAGPPAIPIGKWFHIEMFLRRAADASGEVQVFQDGLSVLHLTNVVTDDSRSAQWYVGNLANNLNPPNSTLYVDDVSVGGTH